VRSTSGRHGLSGMPRVDVLLHVRRQSVIEANEMHVGASRELHDLSADPEELNNVFGSMQTAEAERVLVYALTEWPPMDSTDLAPHVAVGP
jgi:hypothetical protein